MQQIKAYDFYGISSYGVSVFVSVVYRPFCLPTESDVRHITVDDATLSMRNPKSESNRIAIFGLGSSSDVYSKTIANLSRLYFSKIYSSFLS